MPTYAYACGQCDHHFETFQSIKAGPLRKCPQCGKTSLRRLIGTGAGILFKGSGFYITDYRSDSYKKAADGDSGGAKDKTVDKKEKKTESATTPAASKTESSPVAKKKSA